MRLIKALIGVVSVFLLPVSFGIAMWAGGFPDKVCRVVFSKEIDFIFGLYVLIAIPWLLCTIWLKWIIEWWTKEDIKGWVLGAGMFYW